MGAAGAKGGPRPLFFGTPSQPKAKHETQDKMSAAALCDMVDAYCAGTSAAFDAYGGFSAGDARSGGATNTAAPRALGARDAICGPLRDVRASGICELTLPPRPSFVAPTIVPTFVPSAAPTFVPTFVPTLAPTIVPTFVPTSAPSDDDASWLVVLVLLAAICGAIYFAVRSASSRPHSTS